jgi:hypothetical protein
MTAIQRAFRYGSDGVRLPRSKTSRFEPLNERGNGITGFSTGEPADWKVGVTEDSFMGRGFGWTGANKASGGGTASRDRTVCAPADEVVGRFGFELAKGGRQEVTAL